MIVVLALQIRNAFQIVKSECVHPFVGDVADVFEAPFYLFFDKLIPVCPDRGILCHPSHRRYPAVVKVVRKEQPSRIAASFHFIQYVAQFHHLYNNAVL